MFAQIFQSDFEPAVFGMDMVCIICSLLWPYLFCHYGNSTMDKVSTIGDIAYNSNWFELPVKLQKQFIFIILRSHKRSSFIGFHLIPCTMQVFGQVSFKYKPAVAMLHRISLEYSVLFCFQVLKSACSYYVFFRELSQH